MPPQIYNNITVVQYRWWQIIAIDEGILVRDPLGTPVQGFPSGTASSQLTAFIDLEIRRRYN
jgi:hypothetical protein